MAKRRDDGQLAIGQENWFVEMANTAGIPFKTLQNWWNAFCKETGLALTPTQALDLHKQQFFDWLEAQQRQEEAEKARTAQAHAATLRYSYRFRGRVTLPARLPRQSR